MKSELKSRVADLLIARIENTIVDSLSQGFYTANIPMCEQVLPLIKGKLDSAGYEYSIEDETWGSDLVIELGEFYE